MASAARIFVADSAEPAKPAIIAALYRTPDGVWTEQQSPEVLVDWREPEKLAAAVRRAIERFALKDVDLRHGKLTDRPSFCASRLPDRPKLREHVQFHLVRIEAELFYDASMEPWDEPDIVLHVTIKQRCVARGNGLKAFETSRCVCRVESAARMKCAGAARVM